MKKSPLFYAVCIQILIALLYVQVAKAAVIGEEAFSGSEVIHTFGAGTNSFSGSNYVESVSDLGAIQVSDSSLDIISAGTLFYNIAGASLDNAIRDLNQNAYLTVDLIGFGYNNPIPEYSSNPPGDGVNRVGGLIGAGGDPSSQWLITIYDINLNAIESSNFSQPATDEAVFFGFESSTDIARITIDKVAGLSVGYTFLDDIRYEAVVPVPAAAWLFGSGLLGLIGVARRKKAA